MSESQISQILRTSGDRPYRNLVQHHLKRNSKEKKRNALMGEIALLPEPMKSDWEAYTASLNAGLGWDINLWFSDTCNTAFERIISDAILVFDSKCPFSSPKEALHPQNAELALCLFQIATLTFAISAELDLEKRKFMEIKKGLFR